MNYIIIVAVVVGLAYIIRRHNANEKSRIERLTKYANENGMGIDLCNPDSFPDLDQFKELNPITVGLSEKCVPVLSRELDDITVHVGTVYLKCQVRGGASGRGHFKTSMLHVKCNALDLSAFTLADKMNPLANYASGQDVEFENGGDFTNRYQLVAKNTESTKKVFTEHVRDVVNEFEYPIYVDGCGDEIIFYIHAELDVEMCHMLHEYMTIFINAIN